VLNSKYPVLKKCHGCCSNTQSFLIPSTGGPGFMQKRVVKVCKMVNTWRCFTVERHLWQCWLVVNHLQVDQVVTNSPRQLCLGPHTTRNISQPATGW